MHEHVVRLSLQDLRLLRRRHLRLLCLLLKQLFIILGGHDDILLLSSILPADASLLTTRGVLLIIQAGVRP